MNVTTKSQCFQSFPCKTHSCLLSLCLDNLCVEMYLSYVFRYNRAEQNPIYTIIYTQYKL